MDFVVCLALRLVSEELLYGQESPVTKDNNYSILSGKLSHE